MTKYTSEGARALVESGVGARAETTRQLAESIGGKLVGWWLAESGGYHSISLLQFPDDYPDAQTPATALQMLASGAVEEVVAYRLHEPEAVDAAGSMDWRPPGAND